MNTDGLNESKVYLEILEQDKYNSLLTEYTNTLRLRSNPDKLVELSELRNIPLETLKEAGIFYIGSMAEMLLPKYIDSIKKLGVISQTNNKPIFNERWVIPINDTDGKVQGLVGYSNKADERYIYGTSRYYERRDTLYGLENLELAYDMGYAVVTEGITDTLRLRSLGIKNSFARCGTHKSEFILNQLNRCRHGVISIPDRDTAGMKSKKYWKFNRYITIHIDIKYKDCDEMLREGDNIGIFMDCLNASIEELKRLEHKGGVFAPLDYTII